MRQLKHFEQKLLKKVDLVNFKTENTEYENAVIGKFGLRNRDEFDRYDRVARDIRSLVADIRKLPHESPVRIQITAQLIDKLYRIGAIKTTNDLEEVEKIGASALCRRRLTTVLREKQMAQHLKHATDLVEHGHIRVGPEIVRDPAMLITRQNEDLVTWAPTSKYRRTIQEFNNNADDFNLLQA